MDEENNQCYWSFLEIGSYLVNYWMTQTAFGLGIPALSTEYNCSLDGRLCACDQINRNIENRLLVKVLKEFDIIDDAISDRGNLCEGLLTKCLAAHAEDQSDSDEGA